MAEKMSERELFQTYGEQAGEVSQKVDAILNGNERRVVFVALALTLYRAFEHVGCSHEEGLSFLGVLVDSVERNMTYHTQQ